MPLWRSRQEKDAGRPVAGRKGLRGADRKRESRGGGRHQATGGTLTRKRTAVRRRKPTPIRRLQPTRRYLERAMGGTKPSRRPCCRQRVGLLISRSEW